MIYAVLENNVVVNVIIADSKEIAEKITELTCIETTNDVDGAKIGWTYVDGKFFEPVLDDNLTS